MRIECHGCKVQYEVDDDTDLMVMQCPNCQCRNGWRVVELITCSECQNAIAKDAPLCPHCGHQFRPVKTSPDVKRISSLWILAVGTAFALIHIALVWLMLDLTVGRAVRAMFPPRGAAQSAPVIPGPTYDSIMQQAAEEIRRTGYFSSVEVRGDSVYARVAEAPPKGNQITSSIVRGYVRTASLRLKLAGLKSEVYGAVIDKSEPIPPKLAYYEVIADAGRITKDSMTKVAKK